MRLDVIELGMEAIPAVDAFDPIELWWLAQLEGDPDLDRDVAGPALEVPQVLAVEHDRVQEGDFGDLARLLG